MNDVPNGPVVLVDSVSVRKGAPRYYAGMSAIGPYTTTDREKAVVFDSSAEAAMSPAWSNMACLWDAEPAKGKKGR